MVEAIIIIGVIALFATVIKYPKDVGKGAISFLLLPFHAVMDSIALIFFPLGLLIIFVERKIGINYLTKLIERKSFGAKKKTTARKQINFQKFKKYIVINSITEQIKDELWEANECCPEVNIEQMEILKTERYSVIETPKIGFYGYNFLIQWLTHNMKGHEIVGFATNRRTRFITIVNTDGDNDLIGQTNTGKKFWVSMYDDLDNNQFLWLSDKIELNSKLTTESLEKMVKNAVG